MCVVGGIAEKKNINNWFPVVECLLWCSTSQLPHNHSSGRQSLHLEGKGKMIIKNYFMGIFIHLFGIYVSGFSPLQLSTGGPKSFFHIPVGCFRNFQVFYQHKRKHNYTLTTHCKKAHHGISLVFKNTNRMTAGSLQRQHKGWPTASFSVRHWRLSWLSPALWGFLLTERPGWCWASLRLIRTTWCQNSREPLHIFSVKKI